jgi:hypothetical protein
MRLSWEMREQRQNYDDEDDDDERNESVVVRYDNIGGGRQAIGFGSPTRLMCRREVE